MVQLVKLCFLACVSASYPAPCVSNFFTINAWFDAINVMLAHQIIGPQLLGSCNPLRPRSQAHVTYSQSQIKHNFVPRHCWKDHVRPQLFLRQLHDIHHHECRAGIGVFLPKLWSHHVISHWAKSQSSRNNTILESKSRSVSWFGLLQIFVVVARALFFVSPICKRIIIQIGNDYYFRKTVWLILRT